MLSTSWTITNEPTTAVAWGTGVYTLLVEGRRFATGTNAFAFNVEPRGNTPPTPLTTL